MTDRDSPGLARRLLVDDVSNEPGGGGFALPTGTVSFLLTDVEGSSRRWEHAPASMAAAVSRHYALLDAIVAAHGGVRPVEQGEGDSVVAAFARASDAVAAAVDAQRQLVTEQWPEGAELRVRMAIHTGEAQLRDEGNYFGQTVIRCARLRGIAHGGQILVSEATHGLVVDRLRDGLGLADLGTHRLKDLGRPERVWQLVHPDLPATHPPLRSLDAHRHNLPIQLTPLIGREDDVAALGRLVGDERLVTLTGSGGVGKTRLALAVSAEVVEQFPGGVWLVELAGVSDRAGVGPTVLAALGAHQVPGLLPVEQLIATLPEAPSLLVLDNCEHLLDECAALVAALLARHVAVRVLATAREPLAVPGEITWRVRSLATPPPESARAVPVVSQYEAVQLFIDRARRAHPTFVVSEANAPAVAQICHRLDGIPLALELAAARCRQMSAENIALDLDDRFRLLTGGARTVLPRQQTLAASIDWSHDRLDETEQVVFRRLGVFAGIFPLAGAEAVASAIGDMDPVTVFEVVSRLVDKSLVLAEERPGGEQCYRLLETLRAYAIDRARAAGELVSLRDAHMSFWLDWLENQEPVLHTDDVIERVVAFHDCLAAALEWSTREPSVGLRLLRRWARPLQGSGRPQAVLTAVDELLTEENAERFPVAWVAAAGTVFVLVGTARSWSDAAALLVRGQALAEEAGEEYWVALSRFLLRATEENSQRLRELAHQRGQRYVECIAVIGHAAAAVEADPLPALTALDEPELLAAARESRYLRDFADRTLAGGKLALGELSRCRELGHLLASSPSTLIVESAARLSSAAALLMRDEAEADAVVALAEARLRGLAGTRPTAELVTHRQALLAGAASRVDPDLLPEHFNEHEPLSASSLLLQCREAVDAGASEVALEAVRLQSRWTPFGQAVRATIEATAALDEDRWHESLTLAVRHGLRVVAVDALEGLAVVAAVGEAWFECLRLAAAAGRLRGEAGYRWRFRFEQQRLDAAIQAATDALGTEAAARAEFEGAALDWRVAADYASRARGERKRPSHGWAALTPTEQRVVALIAEGLTNPMIAERLLMGRATVKTHVDHVFAKTGLHSRTELAAEYVRRVQGRRS
jgi:predicted ATPase/class 3 adenylate cyclase/DNA-binding CsgD family transcriptional regulator